MIVARMFTPGIRLADTEAARWTFYKTAEHMKNYNGLHFIELPCIGDYGYREQLRFLFSQTDDVCIVEGDLLLYPEHVDDLRKCERPSCVWAYRIFPESTKLGRPVFAHRDVAAHHGPPFVWIDEGQKQCDYFGLGLARFRFDSPAFQRIRLALDEDVSINWHYSNCDVNISRAVFESNLGCRTHVHWPEMVHLHA